jgi:hypothetical protein
MDFVHRTFQDYLGAKAAVEGLDFDFLLANAHLDQWEDVIRMAVAHARPMERNRLLTGLIRRESASPRDANRLCLLAAACLEHAIELDPAVHAEVEKRTETLIPPRSADQARALIEIGPVVLDLLPGPSEELLTPGPLDTGGDLTEAAAARQEKRDRIRRLTDEAYFTVFTAARIGTDAAITVLAQYRELQDLQIRTELAQAWSRFDTDTYGEEVIAHLSERDLYFPVYSIPELAWLRRFGGRSHMRVNTAFPIADFVNHCHKGRLTHIWIEANTSEKWDWLRNFHDLVSVTIETSLPRLDIGGLARISGLREVRVPADVIVSGTDLLPRSVEVRRERLGPT